VERISDDRLRDPAMGDWKGKDVLAHLAWWHDHSVLVIEGLRADLTLRFEKRRNARGNCSNQLFGAGNEFVIKGLANRLAALGYAQVA
jgi:hypothetical protein